MPSPTLRHHHRISIDITTRHSHCHDFKTVRQSVLCAPQKPKSGGMEQALPLLPSSFMYTDSNSFATNADRSSEITEGITEEQTVHFADPIEQFKETIGRDTITAQERSQYWYTRQDLARLQTECEQFIRRVRTKKGKLDFTNYSKDVRWNDSIRGAELMDSFQSRLYLTRVKVSTNVVLNCQKNCHDQNLDYETCLLKISDSILRKSKITQKEAYERANSDYQVAQDMHALMDGGKTNTNTKTRTKNKSNVRSRTVSRSVTTAGTTTTTTKGEGTTQGCGCVIS